MLPHEYALYLSYVYNLYPSHPLITNILVVSLMLFCVGLSSKLVYLPLQTSKFMFFFKSCAFRVRKFLFVHADQNPKMWKILKRDWLLSEEYKDILLLAVHRHVSQCTNHYYIYAIQQRRDCVLRAPRIITDLMRMCQM